MFLVIVLVGLYVGRKIGWLISVFLYGSPRLLCVILCMIWGLGIALGLRFLIDAFRPGIIIKALSFGAGFYIASPSYGLVAESTIPESEMRQHEFITYVTPGIFAVCSAVLAVASKN